MNKILVPTDFSEPAFNAVKYAHSMCEDLGLSMQLIHIMHVPAVDLTGSVTVLEDLMASQQKNANNRLNEMADSFAGSNVAISVTSKFGLGADVIVETAEQDDFDMVVMGSHGATGILDRIMGGVSLAVSKRSKQPVLIVPFGATYESPKHLMFAFDHLDKISKELEFVHQFANKYNAAIDIVSVEPDSSKTFETEVICDEGGIKEVVVWDKTIINGLTTYRSENNINMVVVKRHHRTFIEELFHTSTTKELLKEGSIPLLIFN